MVDGGSGGGGGMTAAQMHAQGLTGGNAQAPDKDAKPADLSDFINQLLDKTGAWLSKATGVNINSLFKTGIFAHTDIQAGAIKTDNMINMAVPDSRGGALANIVFGEVFNKGGAGVTDHAAGVGGDASGAGAASGGHSDFGGGHVDTGGSNHNFDAMALGPMPTGNMRFDWDNMPNGIAALGNMTPQATPGAGVSSGASMAV